jgi:hypothetical protein
LPGDPQWFQWKQSADQAVRDAQPEANSFFPQAVVYRTKIKIKRR